MWPLLIFGALAIGFGLLLRQGGKDPKRREALPLTRIADAGPGREVKLEGRLEAELPRLAPVSKRPCAYYRCTVYAGSGDDRQTLTTLAEYAEGARLVDDSGAVEIDLSSAELLLNRQQTGHPLFSIDPDLERITREVPAVDRWRVSAIVEERLEIGERAVAIGRITPELEGPVLGQTGELLVCAGGNQQLAQIERLTDTFAWLLLLAGVGLLGLGVFSAFQVPPATAAPTTLRPFRPDHSRP